MESLKFSLIHIIIFILIFLVTPFLWGPFLISGGDVFPIVYPFKQILYWASSWDYQNSLGSPSSNNVCAILPFLSFSAFLEALNIPPQLIQRIWIIFIMISQFISMYYFLGRIGILSKNARFVSALLYVLNPVNGYLLTAYPIAVAAILMPLSLGLLIDGIGKNSKRYFVILIIVSFIFSYVAVNPGVFIAAWIPLFAYIFVNFLDIKKLLIFIFLVGFFLINLYWVLNLFNLSGDISMERGISWVFWTTRESTFLNLFRFKGEWAWNAKAFDSSLVPYKTFYDIPGIIIISFLLTIISFSIFLNNKQLDKFKKKNLLTFAMLFLIILFIIKGLNDPLSGINRFAYESIPFFWIFRTPWSKLMPVAVFSFMVLFCYAIEAIERNILEITHNRRKILSLKIFSLTILMVVIIFGIPYFSGKIFSADRGYFPGNRIIIPEYWFEAARYVDNKDMEGKILLLPENPFYQMHYFWPKDGYYGIDPIPHFIFKRIVSRTPGGGFVEVRHSSELIKLLYKTIADSDDKSIDLLRMANIEYIFHRNDLDWTHIGSNRNSTIWEPAKIKRTINELPFTLEKNFGKIKSNLIETDQYFKESILRFYPYMEEKTALDLYKIQDNYFLPQIYASQ